MIHTVWYRCAKCEDRLAEYRDVDVTTSEDALRNVPPMLIHYCDEYDGAETGQGVAHPFRVVTP